MSLEQKIGSQKRAKAPAGPMKSGVPASKTRFAGHAVEVIEKQVKQSGNAGRIYLPPEWVGKNVKLIRLD